MVKIRKNLLLRLLALSLAWMAPLAGLEAEVKHGDEDDAILETVKGRFLLMDHWGRAVTHEDYWGKFVLISFGYTFCPDVCPTTLANMAGALRRLGEDSKRIQPLFVSVDPERDSLEVLRKYVTYFHPDVIGLTGSAELVRRAADNFAVKYEKVLEPGRDPNLYSVDHSAGIYLMSPGGQFLAKFAHALPPEELAGRIRVFLDQEQHSGVSFGRVRLEPSEKFFRVSDRQVFPARSPLK